MEYLRAEDILVIHAEIINATGGLHGVSDAALLASIAEKPRAVFDGKELYPDVYTKAAVYLEAVANYHVFADGNKRSAFAIAVRFLFLAGVEINAEQQEIVDVMLRVATKEISIEEIAIWLENHTK